MSPITSSQNPRLKSAIRLKTRRGRDDQNRFLIDGFREIERCLQSHAIHELFVCREWVDEDEYQRLRDRFPHQSMETFELPPHLFAKLAYGDRSDGVVATAFQFESDLESIPIGDSPLVAVVESIEKPGNLGAILRSADAAGVSAVVHVEPVSDWFNPNTIRASTGALFSLPCCNATFEQFEQWTLERKLALFAATPDASLGYTDANYQGACGIVLGNEANGLSDRWTNDIAIGISVPMLGRVDSLNVSVTAAVVFFEAARQRRQLVD